MFKQTDSSLFIQFTYELDSGILLEIEGDTNMQIEPAYGSDIDGHRGSPSIWLEDTEIKILYNMCDVTELFKEVAPELLERLYVETEDKLLDKAWDIANDN